MTQIGKGKTSWQDFLFLIRQSQKTYCAIKTKLSHLRKEHESNKWILRLLGKSFYAKEFLREQGYKTKQKTGTSV